MSLAVVVTIVMRVMAQGIENDGMALRLPVATERERPNADGQRTDEGA
jgi:hypothetical protein